MRYFSVHAPPDDADSPERYAFVKDGFSWPALFFPAIWMLWHRLWLALVWYIVFVLVVAWTGRLTNEDIAIIVAILGGILLALEANNIRRVAMEGRGWEEVGSSFGRNLSEAETRFFASGTAQGMADPRDRRAAMLRAAYGPEPGPVASDEPILGLFPQPER